MTRVPTPEDIDTHLDSLWEEWDDLGEWAFELQLDCSLARREIERFNAKPSWKQLGYVLDILWSAGWSGLYLRLAMNKLTRRTADAEKGQIW